MIDFGGVLDLPLVWYGLIGTALFLYVLLDGFDLGVGILFPFAPSDLCRDRMMNSIAPFWDGNETWLVLSGGGLLAAFPLAYAILMPALYIPVILMLLGLIFRGVAFEFRFKASGNSRKIWDYAFHYGSLLAALTQGMIIGAIVRGVEVQGRAFAGGSFDWLNAYSVMTGVAVIFGYALLGSTWLVLKTDGVTQDWARGCASYVLGYVGLFLGVVSLSMPMMNADVRALWFGRPTFFYLLPVPLATAALFAGIWRSLHRGRDGVPFLLSVGVFFMAYLGIGISLWPWIVPFEISYRQAAAASTSQTLLFIGTALMLPVVLAYVAFCYYVFRGKASHEGYY